MSSELISVIVPVYNCRNYLADAIDSVLGQTFSNVELIVIDDGSTDGSAEIAKQYGDLLQYYFQPNAGIGPARNTGIRASKGDFLAFLDADDLWARDKLELQVSAFRRDSTLDLVFTHLRQVRSDEIGNVDVDSPMTRVGVVPGYLPSTMMVKRRSFDRVGPFEKIFRVGEFADWYLRARDLRLNMGMLPELLVWRRLHDSNNWTRQREARSDYAHVLKAALDRRRSTVTQVEPRENVAPSVTDGSL